MSAGKIDYETRSKRYWGFILGYRAAVDNIQSHGKVLADFNYRALMIPRPRGATPFDYGYSCGYRAACLIHHVPNVR